MEQACVDHIHKFRHAYFAGTERGALVAGLGIFTVAASIFNSLARFSISNRTSVLIKTTDFKAKFYQFGYVFLILFLGILFFIIATKIISTMEYPNSDFFSFWLSGKLASIGQNPYNNQIWILGHHQFNATWISDATFLYPLPLALLFTPLGLLPLYDAFVVWDVLTQFMIVFAVVLLMIANSNQSFKHFILPLFAGVILFRPTIITLINGQLSGMLLLLIAAIIYLWEKGNWKQGAILMAILALKPNLGIPIIGLLSVYLILQKQISALIEGAISGGLLVCVGLAQNHDWIIEFFSVGNTKFSQTFGYSPTVWGMSAFFCNHNLNCTIGYGLFVSLSFLIGCLYLFLKKQSILSPSLIVSLAVIITLLLTPYTWPYDQLLLIAPITTITMQLSRDGYRYLPISFIFIAIDIFALILLSISAKVQLEIWNVFVPLIVFSLLVWYLSKNEPISQITRAG